MTFYLMSCAYTFARCWANINISSAIFVLFFTKSIELFLFLNLSELQSYMAYTTWVGIDLCVVFSLMFKVAILRKINPTRPVNDFVITQADMLLIALYAIHTVINILALGEHILRNLDDFGLPEQALWVVYLNEHARLFYYLSMPIKQILHLFEIGFIWLTIKNYWQSSRVLKA